MPPRGASRGRRPAPLVEAARTPPKATMQKQELEQIIKIDTKWPPKAHMGGQEEDRLANTHAKKLALNFVEGCTYK